jgi:hypothetical protein
MRENEVGYKPGSYGGGIAPAKPSIAPEARPPRAGLYSFSQFTNPGRHS